MVPKGTFRNLVSILMKILLSFLLACTIGLTSAQSFDYTRIAPHPRLLLKKGEAEDIRKNLETYEPMLRVHRYILDACEQFMIAPTVERKLEGKRLLGVSRTALKRIFYLAYAYRMTGDKRYSQRAEQEMLAASAFADWNPSHFLDVGEMTMALALGYDWLFDVLQPSSRETIRKAIIEKGFTPSKDEQYNWFLKADHNWNQVCNAGMAYGALALYETDTALATEMLERCMQTIGLSMKAYDPDGAYPEGYNYWGYGTGFQVMLNAGLESALGTDKGLSQLPGFLPSARFMEYMTGPTGASFNFSDAREKGEADAMMYWFAKKTNDPSLLWVEQEYLKKPALVFAEDRLLPCMIIFGSGLKPSGIAPPQSKIWVGHGKTPVVLVRTSWLENEGLYLGAKGGSAATNHAHMDAGSFVFEAAGVRWAMDLGMQEYYSLEKENVDLWNRSQTGQRWEVFRYNNFAHNTLTVNGKLHRVEGFAPVVKTFTSDDKLGAVIDLTEIFKDDLKKSSREVAIVKEKFLQVKDEIETTNQPARIRWTLVTAATPKFLNANTIELSSGGKRALLVIESPKRVELKTWPAQSQHTYDAPNPGISLVGFETELKANQKSTLVVKLVPQP